MLEEIETFNIKGVLVYAELSTKEKKQTNKKQNKRKQYIFLKD